MLSRRTLTLIVWITLLIGCGSIPLSSGATDTPSSGQEYQGRPLPPAWHDMPDVPTIWLVSPASAVTLRPIALVTSSQQIPPTLPLALSDIPRLSGTANQTLTLVVATPIVAQLRITMRDAAQGPLRSLNEPGREVASAPSRDRDLTVFQLAVIGGAQEILLHVQLTYATEPGGATRDPATGEAHYVVLLAP